jgi:hypothetical protein
VAKTSPRRSTRSVSRGDVARLKDALAAFLERVEQLERAMEINIKRMAAIQAEIDHLRATRHDR